MSKHTPGPWQIIKFPEAIIVACNPKIDRCATICELPMPSIDEEAEEIEANVRLIAAAPMMLEALENAVGAMETADNNGAAGLQKAIETALEAIAAAKGEA